MTLSTDSDSEELDGEKTAGVLALEEIVIQDPKSHIKFPFSILFSTIIYCGEVASALYMFEFYRQKNEKLLMAFTIGIIIIEAILDQVILMFFDMDLARNRAVLVLSHILFLGPIVRCLQIIINYIKLAKKKQQKKKNKEDNGINMMLEKEDILSICDIIVQCKSFKCMSVIQAFMCSAPQLIAQLYITFNIREWPLSRAILTTFSLLSVTYGAILCNILTIQIKYDDAKLHPLQYLHIMIWRSLEITSRVVTVVLFITSLKLKSMYFILITFSISFLAPWLEFWRSGAHRSRNRRKRSHPKCTLVVITLLYATIDFSCWSSVKLKFSSEEIIDKTQKWVHRALHYIPRFLENVIMVLIFRYDGRKTLLNCCDTVIAVQLILSYILSIGFMLIFYEYLCPGSCDLP
ncbi:XK-related protein 3 [Ochotona princeps]|uniref:XK-related protein 3 n=1 Tax=Ochotona princeps TaxID=9978 RepID=UPI0027152EBF|nr:XK-related protein 3 [Ochotona princeps]